MKQQVMLGARMVQDVPDEVTPQLLAMCRALCDEENVIYQQSGYAVPRGERDLSHINTFFYDGTFVRYIYNKVTREVFGFCAIFNCAHSLVIDTLYVKEEYRRQGWAEYMIRDVFQSHPDRNIDISFLSNNEISRKLYEKLGFVPMTTTYTLKRD